MRIKGANRLSLKLAAPAALAVAMMAFGAVAWAGGDSGGDLNSEVQQLQQEVQELKGEVSTLKTEQTVSVPAAGSKSPTIGEQVGSIGKDLGDIKTNLSTNLGVHIHGLVDATYEFNFNQPKTAPPGAPNGRVNQLHVFDLNANSFDLQQGNIHIDRTTDGGVGFVTDINFGAVANVLSTATHYSNAFTIGTQNVDLTQAYMTYTLPVQQGVNFSLGRFVTLLGEETIPTWNAGDFNVSRDFIFGYAIPFTHTGLRAQYNFNSYVGATLGVNNGWDDVSDNNDGKSIEGQLSLNSGSLMSENQSLAFVLSGIWGAENSGHGNTHRWVIDPILTYHTPIAGLQLIDEFVYGQDDGNDLVTPIPVSQAGAAPSPFAVSNPTWSGDAGYIVYDYTDNLEFALRGEWFRDANGARTGLRQTLGEVTGTVNYKIPAVTGLLARLEYRHDESSAKPFFTNAGINPLTGSPYQTIAGQNTVIGDVVYSF